LLKEEGGRKIMCEAVEKYVERCGEESRLDERSETVMK
jgi:hypothetical protein